MIRIGGHTGIVAVFGDPVSHSLSPVMQNGWIEDANLDALYIALAVSGPEPEAFFAALKQARFLGANVTVPHKERAAACADVRHGLVEKLGVANTLKWEAGGTISAHNTDAPGFLAALEEGAPGWKPVTQTALILGAGGAARAIAQALADEGVALIVANRTRPRAEDLIGEIGGGDVLDWAALEQGFARADLIVNTTTLGMKSQSKMLWPIAAAKPGAIVYDAVYAPLETDLLRAAAARGLKTVDGLGMLIHQGALAFEIWFGEKPDTGLARQRLLAALAERGG